MSMRRTAVVALATLALAETGSLLLSVGSTAEPSKSQQLFRKMLLDDPKTTTAIKRLLRERGGFVAPAIEFADLTGDGRSDAVVLVDTGGAAGAVALYVFSTDGEDADSPLRVVYRSQQLYRASAAIVDATLVLRTPAFVEGDELCCPAKILERVYAWSDGARTLRQRSSRELPGSSRGTPAPPP